MPLRKDRRAVSIVELLVAVAVLTFGLYAVYDQFRMAGLRSRPTQLEASGRYYAHQALEEIRARPYPSIAAWTPDTQYAPIGESSYRSRAELTRGGEGEPIEIRVFVRWDDPANDLEPAAPDKGVSMRGWVVP